MKKIINADRNEAQSEEKRSYKIIISELLSANVSPSRFAFILFGHFPKGKIDESIEAISDALI
ncbi:MAG: hypothetical protein LBG94_02510 [Treponema sp.]|jgi:hypothetical protein|nr:hypothetical protein [Treponema sp.]